MITRKRATEIARQLNGLRGSESSGQWLAYASADGSGGNHIHTSPHGLGDGVVVLRIPTAGARYRYNTVDVIAAFS